MRVDSCTTEVKECLQSEDRCGKDYTQCIGLDTDTIIRMCPYDKLVGCQKVYGETNIRGDQVYDELANMVQGIMLNIDNSFLTECQNAANEAMIKVCGDTQDCTNLTIDDGIGSRSLDYKICEYTNGKFTDNCKMNVDQIQDEELGRNDEDGKSEITNFAGKVEGEIPWDSISFIGTNGELLSKATIEEKDFELTEKAENELNLLRNNIQIAIETIEADPKVQFCMTGREVQGMKTGVDKQGKKTRTKIGEKSKDAERFPGLTGQMRAIIATAALKKAQDNYSDKYDEIQDKITQDYIKIAERTAENMKENSKDFRREAARLACINYANGAVLGTSLIRLPVPTDQTGLELVGSAVRDSKGYKETVTSTFNWNDLICTRCVRSQRCTNMKKKFWGTRYCKNWGETQETCKDTQF